MKKFNLKDIAAEARPSRPATKIKFQPFNIDDTIEYEETRPDSNDTGRKRVKLTKTNYSTYRKLFDDRTIRVTRIN